MPLGLIVGPPNSGRARHVRDRLEAVLERDPVLVVPTRDDVDRFEAELAAAGAGFGVTIVLFDGLFEAVAAATGTGGERPLSDAQRLGAVRASIRAADLGPLSASAQRPGFAPAVAELIEEIGVSTLDPATLTANAADSGDRYLADLAKLNSEYAGQLSALGRSDSHGKARAATDAMRQAPAAWGDRPVFLYGFDDLSVEQRELVQALAEAVEVTATVTYEDREAFAARATLREELQQLGGEIELELPADPDYTDSEVLFHLDRSFLVAEAESVEVAPGEGLELFEAAGTRAQAEQIGEEVARLLASGVAPGEVAVALRNPDRDGSLYDAVFAGLGISVATHARIPLISTATGRALLLALRLSRAGADAGELVSYLRCPGRGNPADVDWLERQIRRGRLTSAEQAREAWRGRDLFEIAQLREAGGSALLLRAASLASRFAEYPDQRQAPRPGARRRLELRAGALAARSLAELAELDLGADAASEAIATLEELTLPLWQGAAPGRVTVSAPYRLRAGRFSHVFVAPLQLGEFPRRARTDAMLGDEQRAALGMPKRADAEEEERYLFAVCLSLPTERLYLCWQPSDEDGAAAIRSPFLEEVRGLLAPEAPEAGEHDAVLEALTRHRPLATTMIAPADPAELATRRQAAAARVDLPGPLEADPVLERLRDRELFSASGLEEFRRCSYRWFVERELRPEPLDPKPEAMAMGNLVHGALESIYSEPPVLGRRPTPETIDEWRKRARELVEPAAVEAGLAGSDPSSIAARVRAEAQVIAFLERDSRSASPMMPVADMLEASFGDAENDQMPPLELDGFKLRGKIDRVDVGGPDGGRRALLRDYKTSREVTKGADLAKEGKLQLQLYAIAVAELWELPPAGALYEPLGATADHRPRGIATNAEPGLLDGIDMVRNDIVDPEAFAEVLDEAQALAAKIVGRMRKGDIRRDPLDQECPKWCEFAPICRRERARPVIEDEDEEEELKAS